MLDNTKISTNWIEKVKSISLYDKPYFLPLVVILLIVVYLAVACLAVASVLSEVGRFCMQCYQSSQTDIYELWSE